MKMATRKPKEPVFDMPMEVKNWIEQANSRLKHMQSEIDRLKQENKELKVYRNFAEKKITRSEAE
jgi:cell shape-determining protein MreC